MRARVNVHTRRQHRESDRRELWSYTINFPLSAQRRDQSTDRTFWDDGLSLAARRFSPPVSREETMEERTSGRPRGQNKGVAWCSSSLNLPQTFGADSSIPRLSFCISLLPSILGDCNAVCLCRTASIVMLKTAVQKKKE